MQAMQDTVFCEAGSCQSIVKNAPLIDEWPPCSIIGESRFDIRAHRTCVHDYYSIGQHDRELQNNAPKQTQLQLGP